MKTNLDCYPCFLRQALDAARMAGAREDQQRQVMTQVLQVLRGFDPDHSPAQMAYCIHHVVRGELGVLDLFREAKEASTREALALYPRLKGLVLDASDPLDTAVRLSIAGNIIDLGALREYDLTETIERVQTQPFAINDLGSFRENLARVENILYLADNAGETVFDRVLIELLERPVTYAVKSGPILNDAVHRDAQSAGLEPVTTIVETGSDAPGTILDLCSSEFRQLFDRADLIIAKGQANYETLSDTQAPLFFLLQIKCPVIAQDLGVPIKSIVLKQALF
jgi:uncharacterized protein with ATP-grasp and redox domains